MPKALPEALDTESDNARKLAELRELIRNTARLHETFGRIYGEVCRD